MRLLIMSLISLAIALLVVVFAQATLDDPGYVLMTLGQTTVEGTLFSLVFIIILLVLLMYLAVRLYRAGSSSVSSASRWLIGGRKSKRQLAFYDGLFALSLGDQKLARQKLEQAQGDEFQGFNYLALGQIALQQGDMRTARTWFDKANDGDNPRNSQVTAVLLAQKHLYDGNPQAALAELDKLPDIEDEQSAKVYAQAMAAANQWQQLETRLPKWKKWLGGEYTYYSTAAATHKFAEIASKQGANQLKEHWQALTRKQRNDEAFRLAFLQQLIRQGVHQDGQKYLVEWYQKTPMPTPVLNLIKALRLKQPAKLIELLEARIKAAPDNAANYAALGHVAYHAGDYALSEKALTKAITEDETEEELTLLAELYERTKAYEQAMQTMRRVNALQR